MKKDNHDELVLFILGVLPVIWLGPVSYTHLDVYKRQLFK